MPKKITRAVYYITILLAVVLFSEKFIIKTLLCPTVSYTDFTSYYIAADAIKQKGSPYDSIDIRDNHIVNVVKPEELERMGIKFSVPEKYAYTYPPVLSLLLVPLTYLKYPSAVVFWNIINLFIFASSVCLTLLIINSRPFALITALTLLLFLGSMPSYETFSLGQVNYFVYSLCLAAFIYEERGQSKLSAFLLAFASVLKVTPVALAFYFLFFSKRKDYIVYYAGFGLGILLLSGLPIGLSNLYYYLTYILPKLAGSYLLDNNKALTSLFSRVFLENPMVTPLLISKTLANTFTAVIAAVIISVTGIILVRAKKLRSYESRVLAFSSCLVFMLLLQTLLEIHHLIYAFLPLLVFIYYSKLKTVTKTGVFLLLIMMLNTRGWNAMVHFGSGWWVIFLTAPQILGLLLLFFFLYTEVSRLRCSANIQTFNGKS